MAASILFSVQTSNVHALSLGKLNVLSHIGEPLLAEVELSELTADELESLKSKAANPEAFVAAGMDYNPLMMGLDVKLQRKQDGRPYLRISNNKSVNDPFVDLLLETSWSSGKIVRDYVMLFDPPPSQSNSTQAQPALAQSPVTIKPNAAAPAASTSSTPAPSAVDAQSKKSTSKTAPASTGKSKTTAPETEINPDSTITVKRGDTASKIVQQLNPEGASLDQMLAALLQANPKAFVASNVNRLREGAVLTAPSAASAKSIDPAEARKIVVSHSIDFNKYRQGVAEQVTEATAPSNSRTASGEIKSQLDDKKTSTNSTDKLTLNKGTVKTDNLDKIAKEKEKKELADRNAAAQKSVEALKKLSSETAPPPPAPAPAPSPAPADTKPVATAPSPAPAAVTPPPQPAPANPVAVVPPAPKPPTAQPAPAMETSMVDDLLQDPLIPAAGGGLLALIAGLFVYKSRQKKKAQNSSDSSFLESKLQPDSFFGITGGQKIDTNQTPEAAPSSMVYSPSQLDAADDVDPVAEADVYLAYGRDLQAEEILKEAAQLQPGRIAVYTKLADIYAKRKDASSLEAAARELLKYSGEQAPEWLHVSSLGRSVDPTNALYQSTSNSFSPAVGDTASNAIGGSNEFDEPDRITTGPMPLSSVDLDLDLDFAPEPPSAPMEIKEHEATPLSFAPTSTMDSLGTSPAPSIELPSTFAGLEMEGLNLDLNTPTGSAPLGADTDMAPVSAQFETKLALAEEFISIGDEDGARALIDEVLAEASGEVRSKAQQTLSKLK